MKIYIDFDDCLCETARHFSGLVYEMFGKKVPYEDICFFDLQKSFALDDKQFEEMMFRAHTPEVLLSYEETLKAARLYCLDKYGRDSFIKNSTFSLKLDDYYKMHFDYAVEDSPLAFKFFDHLSEMKVMVYDRPWNRDHELSGENYHRCYGWGEIRSLVEGGFEE